MRLLRQLGRDERQEEQQKFLPVVAGVEADVAGYFGAWRISAQAVDLIDEGGSGVVGCFVAAACSRGGTARSTQRKN